MPFVPAGSPVVKDEASLESTQASDVSVFCGFPSSLPSQSCIRIYQLPDHTFAILEQLMAPVRTKAVNLEAVLKTLMKSLAILRYRINQGNHSFKGPWMLVGNFGIF